VAAATVPEPAPAAELPEEPSSVESSEPAALAHVAPPEPEKPKPAPAPVTRPPATMPGVGAGAAAGLRPRPAGSPAPSVPLAHRESAQHLYQQALLHQQRNNWPACAKGMEQALLVDATYASANKSAGLCYSRMRRMDKAYCHLRRFVELNPNGADSGQMQAHVRQLEQMGRRVQNCKAVLAAP
jgi:hypothetical protein